MLYYSTFGTTLRWPLVTMAIIIIDVKTGEGLTGFFQIT
jgi:hypothetical protein